MVIVDINVIQKILKSLASGKHLVRIDPHEGVPFVGEIVGATLDSLLMQFELKNIGLAQTSKKVRVVISVCGHSLQGFCTYKSHQIQNGTTTAACDFSLPLELTQRDARDYARISITQEVELSACYILESMELPVTMVDASPAGVKISNRRLELSNYEVGKEGTFEIRRPGSEEIISIKAIIAWKKGQEAGLFFPDYKNIVLENPTDPWLNLLRRILEVKIIRRRSG